MKHADPVAQAEIDRLEASRVAWRSLANKACAEVRGLRAGEDASEKDPAAYPTPGQLWHFLLEASEVNRLRTLAKFQEAADEASRCFLMNHDNLEDENARLRVELGKVGQENP